MNHTKFVFVFTICLLARTHIPKGCRNIDVNPHKPVTRHNKDFSRVNIAAIDKGVMDLFYNITETANGYAADGYGNGNWILQVPDTLWRGTQDRMSLKLLKVKVTFHGQTANLMLEGYFRQNRS